LKAYDGGAAKDGGSAIIGKSSDKSINQENVLRIAKVANDQLNILTQVYLSKIK